MQDLNSDEYFMKMVRINEIKKEKLKKEFPTIYKTVYGEKCN